MVAHFIVHFLFLSSLLVIVSSIVEMFAPFLQLFGTSSALVSLSAPIYLWDCTVVTVSLHLLDAEINSIFFNGCSKVSRF